MASAETARLIASLELQDKLSGPAAKADASLTKLEKSTSKVGTTLSNVSKDAKNGILAGIGVGAGFGAFNVAQQAVQSLVGFVGDAVTAASNLNETMQKSQVVFGSAAAGVKAFGETAATSMGLSENAAISAAASIGNLLLSTGTAPEKIAPMSEAIVKLASDLASFNNISVDDALQKLQSGLVGQERPLRELGVAISAASVDTEALALGFKRVNGTFTEGEKVQARYALIFAQTQTAQGDFARTADGLANSQRILNAEIDDATAKIGAGLTPVVAKLSQALAGVVVAGENAGDGISRFVENSKRELGPVADLIALIQKDLDATHPIFGGLSHDEQVAQDALAANIDAEKHDSVAAFEAISAARLASAAVAGRVVDDLNRMSGELGQSGSAGLREWAAQVTAGLAGVKQLGKQTDEEFVSGLKSGQSDIDSTWQEIIDRLKHPKARAQQIGHDIGILTSKALQTAIQSGDPQLGATARQEVQTVLDELNALKVNSHDIGKKGMAELERAMKSSNPEIAAAARSIYATIESNINLPKRSYYWGRALADGAALGLGSNASQAGFEAAARKLMAAAISGLGSGAGVPTGHGTPVPSGPKPKPKHKGGGYNPQTPGNPDANVNVNVTAIVSSTAISNKQAQSAKFGFYNPSTGT